MRRWLFVGLILIGMGCSQGGPTQPEAPKEPPPVLGEATQKGEIPIQEILAGINLQKGPVATVEWREGQTPMRATFDRRGEAFRVYRDEKEIDAMRVSLEKLTKVATKPKMSLDELKRLTSAEPVAEPPNRTLPTPGSK